MRWIKENASWLFSGIGIIIFTNLNEYLKTKTIGVTWINILQIVTIIITCYFAAEIVLYLKNKRFLKWIKEKNIELFRFLFLNKKTYIDTSLKYECFELHQEYFDRLSFFKDYLCYTQGWLAQYSFIAGETHKNIKDCLRDDPTGPEKKIKLKSLCSELNKELTSYQERIFKETCKYITRHFSSRSKTKTRICLKVVSKDMEVVAVFRDKFEYEMEYQVQDNKGFDAVYSSGNFYICNDIPKEIINKTYWNPRINRDLVREVYFKYYDKKKSKENNQNWRHCWSKNLGSNSQEPTLPSSESCYKSTMIIPLTLIKNEDLQDIFRKHFNIPMAPDNDKETGKAIYGFLCLDNQEINFFNPEVDKRVGYIFADMLSIFMIHRLIFTEYSKTFKDAQEIINA